MTDTITKAERSKVMSKVRSRDTKPEWILRCGLHRLGFRYRLGNTKMPGRPDLVFPKFHAAVFVHGCYWHRHPGCKNATTPKSNVAFWEEKFARNVARDRRTQQTLEALGWRVLVVWECELAKETVDTIQRVARWLREETEDAPVHYQCDLNRKELLAVAEEKVRYRIASYDEKPAGEDAESTKESAS